MKKTYRSIRSWLAASAILAAFAVQAQTINLVPIGTYATGIYDEGASEVVDYDASTQQVYSTNALANSVDILDVSDPTAPVLVTSISLAPYGGGVNSVAVLNGGIAVAVEANVSVKGERDTYYADPIFLIKDKVQVGRISSEISDLGVKITLLNIHPETNEFTLGLNSRQKDWVIIKALEKPFINLLWLGTGILIVGFAIAMARRFKTA